MQLWGVGGVEQSEWVIYSVQLFSLISTVKQFFIVGVED